MRQEVPRTAPAVARVTHLERWIATAMVASVAVYAGTTLLRVPGTYLEWADSGLYDFTYLTAAILCLARARRAPHERWAWTWLAAALGVTIIGDQYYAAVLAQDPNAPWPSVADLFWLLFFPAMYVAVALMIRATIPRFLPSMWLDGLIAVFGVAAISHTLAFDKLISLTDGALAPALVGLAYPVGDLMLLAVVSGAAVLLGRLDGRWILIASGLSVYAAADVWYAFALAHGSYTDGGPQDAAWPAAIMFLGLAAVFSPGKPASRAGPWWSQLLVPGTLSLICVGLLIYGQGRPLPLTSIILIVVTFLLATARVSWTWREVAELANLRDQAVTDDLTGLLNRRGFNSKFQLAVNHRNPATMLGLLVLDLDGFKRVNDSLGHDVGDRLLRVIADRLRRSVRQRDLLARLGGDEFAVIMFDQANLESAEAVAQRIIEALASPIRLDGHQITIGISVGVALCGRDDVDARRLMRAADAAMYQAKGDGGGYHTYDWAAESARIAPGGGQAPGHWDDASG